VNRPPATNHTIFDANLRCPAISYIGCSVEASRGGATKVALIRPKVMLEQITSLKEISAAAGIKGAVILPQGASRATFWRLWKRTPFAKALR
jgi:hypothetical protein